MLGLITALFLLFAKINHIIRSRYLLSTDYGAINTDHIRRYLKGDYWAINEDLRGPRAFAGPIEAAFVQLYLQQQQKQSNVRDENSGDYYRGMNLPPSILSKLRSLRPGDIVPPNILGASFTSTSGNREFAKDNFIFDSTSCCASMSCCCCGKKGVLIQVEGKKYAVDIQKYKEESGQSDLLEESEFLFLPQTVFEVIQVRNEPKGIIPLHSGNTFHLEHGYYTHCPDSVRDACQGHVVNEFGYSLCPCELIKKCDCDLSRTVIVVKPVSNALIDRPAIVDMQ